MFGQLSTLLSLESQTAVVTGGSRGLGREISILLARSGAFVAINYKNNRNAAEDVLSHVRQNGGDGTVMQFDVSDSASVSDAIVNLVCLRGKIDILVNNAGIARDNLIGRLTNDDWNKVVAVNLTGVFNLCKSAAKYMIRNRSGRIVNVSSTAGETGNAGQTNYSASKAGIIGFTKALARELAPRNVLVNCVAPGIIKGGLSEDLDAKNLDKIRDHVPLRRMGEPIDVAMAVLFLCSPMSSYITGEVLRVNGGLYI